MVGESQYIKLYKVGEYPTFGPRVPAEVSSLLGKHRDWFFKGRQCEGQGLGIASFAYYRRVVENIWEKLIDKAIEVAEAEHENEEVIKQLRAARGNNQFRQSYEDASKIIALKLPLQLMINGSSPIALMHRLLSQGLHNLNDEECLEVAQSLRTILFSFAKKVATALEDKREIEDALRVVEKTTNK